jgi:light-regulated signal transduction histidine kinase (bacteriophytochrome)
VTERNRAARELQTMAADLERRVEQRTHELGVANRELEAFAYSVSHDLRTPLRALDGFSQALLEDYAEKLDEVGNDYLRRIRGGSQHMGDIIDALLELSRVSRGELRRERVDLSALAKEVTGNLRAADATRAVTIRIAERAEVMGDPTLLRVLVENLLSNAWKYTSRVAEASIEFRVTSDEKRGRVAYAVCDNGVGFDMAYADKLFGAFQRLHSSKEFEGTGVGLATAQRIVHRHGGEIWAEAAPQAGATFSFTLN